MVVWRVRSGRTALSGLALLVALALVPSSALAGTFTVTSHNDSGAGSLRDAIASSVSGDTIGFDSSLSGQTIKLTSGELLIQHDLRITALGASHLALSGNGESRVLDVNAPADTVTVSGLTIEGGMAPAGGSPEDGGGILDRAGTLNVSDTTVNGNQTAGGKSCRRSCGSGGGIATDSTARMTLTNVTVSGNDAQSGACGGIASENVGALVVVGSTVEGNRSTYGGGICTEGGGGVSIIGSTISGNIASSGSVLAEGGGLVEDGGGTTVINDSSIYGNIATQGAGVAEDGGGTIDITGSTISGNGAAPILGPCTLSRRFHGQPCPPAGVGAGGGLSQDGGGTVNVSNSEILGNGATQDGGAVAAFAGALTITSTTILGNGSPAAGGGVELGSASGRGRCVRLKCSATIIVSNDTLDANIGATSGSLGACDGPTDPSSCSGTIDVRNTILSRGAPANCAVAHAGTIASMGRNLDRGTSCRFMSTGDLNRTDPRLGSLQGSDSKLSLPDHPAYEPLLAGSPAIDAGGPKSNCPSTDERGAARPDSGEADCDIGAYEHQDSSTHRGGRGRRTRVPAGLRLRSVRVRAARAGCMTESSLQVHSSALSNRDCTLAIVALSGTIDRRADGATITVRFAPLARGPASIAIVARVRVANGRWQVSVKLPVRSLERRPFTITYRGSKGLGAARLDRRLRVEIERSNNAPL